MHLRTISSQKKEIERLINGRLDEEVLPTFFEIPSAYRPTLIKTLKIWQVTHRQDILHQLLDNKF